MQDLDLLQKIIKNVKISDVFLKAIFKLLKIFTMQRLPHSPLSSLKCFIMEDTFAGGFFRMVYFILFCTLRLQNQNSKVFI